ncbi:MAG TPA: Imm70 family immunity protein [Terriglobales bacterium]|nr:Imm70 family immunity protein [Terriglobales bacterium]
MGLYLAVFDDGDELDGVEIVGYSDFSAFRNAVVNNLEGSVAGSRFPTLILHSDCDGQWTPNEAAVLEHELEIISSRFRKLPPTPLNSDWQKQVAKTLGLQLNSLYDCFFDVDGEPLLDRLIKLAKLSQARSLPILFQ